MEKYKNNPRYFSEFTQLITACAQAIITGVWNSFEYLQQSYLDNTNLYIYPNFMYKIASPHDEDCSTHIFLIGYWKN